MFHKNKTQGTIENVFGSQGLFKGVGNTAKKGLAEAIVYRCTKEEDATATMKHCVLKFLAIELWLQRLDEKCRVVSVHSNFCADSLSEYCLYWRLGSDLMAGQPMQNLFSGVEDKTLYRRSLKQILQWNVRTSVRAVEEFAGCLARGEVVHVLRWHVFEVGVVFHTGPERSLLPQPGRLAMPRREPLSASQMTGKKWKWTHGSGRVSVSKRGAGSRVKGEGIEWTATEAAALTVHLGLFLFVVLALFRGVLDPDTGFRAP
ncbi:hypothetical protein AAG570_008962 [Ranatra chinensis]|uniref:Uncharacterized protein n=1 Tax=Ranatra chinensis TaxID=642074 RepID=A0ABD0YSF5_9HEMI